MPYMRQGATKVSDHWVRSPLLNVNRACQTCHRSSEAEIKSRVDLIQQTNFDLLQRGGKALMDLLDAVVLAKKRGATPEQLEPALMLQRKAQWRLDFIAAENSMGFHAPQEAARVLGEAADYARQGQVAALSLIGGAADEPSSEDEGDEQGDEQSAERPKAEGEGKAKVRTQPSVPKPPTNAGQVAPVGQPKQAAPKAVPVNPVGQPKQAEPTE
jgi:nitrite reductase (cytochrome c-552)